MPRKAIKDVKTVKTKVSVKKKVVAPKVKTRATKPMHPGVFIKAEFLDANGIRLVDFVEATTLGGAIVSKLIQGNARFTVKTACKVAKALRTTPDVWLNMQQKCDLWDERKTSLSGVKILRGLKIIPASV